MVTVRRRSGSSVLPSAFCAVSLSMNVRRRLISRSGPLVATSGSQPCGRTFRIAASGTLKPNIVRCASASLPTYVSAAREGPVVSNKTPIAKARIASPPLRFSPLDPAGGLDSNVTNQQDQDNGLPKAAHVADRSGAKLHQVAHAQNGFNVAFWHLGRKAMSAQTREAVKPSHARPAATTHATQLGHKGIVASAMVIGQPASARTNWRSATSEKITAARRE